MLIKVKKSCPTNTTHQNIPVALTLVRTLRYDARTRDDFFRDWYLSLANEIEKGGITISGGDSNAKV